MSSISGYVQLRFSASPHASIVAVGLGSVLLVYSYAALRITADAVRLWVLAKSSSCCLSSDDLIESDIDRVRLGSDAVLNMWSRLGCSVGASRKRMSAMRRIADIDAVGVVLVLI